MDSSECKLLTRPSLSLSLFLSHSLSASSFLRSSFAPSFPVPSSALSPLPQASCSTTRLRCIEKISLAHLLARWKMETSSKVLNDEGFSRGTLYNSLGLQLGSVSLQWIEFFLPWAVFLFFYFFVLIMYG